MASAPAKSLGHQTDFIGVPYNFGQPKIGVEDGPRRMKEAGIMNQLIQNGFPVKDVGDLSFDAFENDDPTAGNVKRPRAVGAANKQLADAVCSSLKANHHCVVLGGDHSMAIGSIYGHAQVQPDIGVLWVDAHGDINPPLGSPSGNVHGMPLSFLLHELKDQIPLSELPEEFNWIRPCLRMKDIVYIGIRDLDESEKKIMADHKMTVFTMEKVKELGIETVVQQALEQLSPTCSRPIHLSFDIDGLDPMYGPSTGTPVSGGLSLQEGIYIVEEAAKTGQLSVLDLAEVNPAIGSAEDAQKTLDTANKIVAACFTQRRRLM